MLTDIFEAEATTRNQVLHRLGDQHLRRSSDRRDTGADRDAESTDVVALECDLPGMQTRPDLDPEWPHWPTEVLVAEMLEQLLDETEPEAVGKTS